MRIATLLAAAAALAGLSACATEVAYGPGPYGPGPGYPVAAVSWDGYYDGFYGPFYDGFWGADGVYYYRTGPREAWRRDNDGHFAREARNGFQPVRGHAPGSPDDRGAHHE